MKISKKDSIDIGIITTESFPSGLAATNRLISSKMVLAENYVVKVYIPMPTENKNKIVNKEFRGKYKNLLFIYTNKTTIWPYEKSKIYKFWIMLIGLINLCKYLLVDKPKILIIYTSRIQYRLIAYIFRGIIKYKLIIEEDEYPKILSRTKNKTKKNLHLNMYKLADGMIVMTNELKMYYESIGVKNIFVLPMTVDVERFRDECKTADDSDYFIYVGGGGGLQRDSLINAVRGFHIFSKNGLPYRFLIIGSLEKDNALFKQIEEYIDRNRIKNIEFLGRINPEEIPGLLSNTLGIIMTPQLNYVSGGFPTKLGEFLMSSRPVVVTNVSEMSHFLNTSNSFLIEPGDDNLIAEALNKIVSDRETANLIGLKGRQTAEVAFNAKTYDKEFRSFLNI